MWEKDKEPIFENLLDYLSWLVLFLAGLLIFWQLVFF